MKTKKCLLLFLFILSCSLFTAKAQDQYLVDSLKRSLKMAKHDTVKVNLLYELSKANWYTYSDRALKYAEKSLELSKKINYKKGIGFAYFTIAVTYVQSENYPLSLKFTKMALKTGKEIGNKLLIASAYQNFGVTYNDLYNRPEALKNFFASLKIATEIGNKEIIYWSYLNIAGIYASIGNYDKELKNYLAGLELAKEIGNKADIASSYISIGECYSLTNYKEALRNFVIAQKISEEINDKNGIGTTYHSIGDIYFNQNNYNDALKNYFSSLKTFEDIRDNWSIGYSNFSIGLTYIKLNDFKMAEQFLTKGLIASKLSKRLGLISSSYYYLAIVDSSQGNFKQAFDHHKLYMIYRDSVNKSKNTEKVTQQYMQYDFDKKEEIAKTVQDKKDAVEQLTRNILISAFIAVLIFAFIFLIQKNKISKAKRKSEELLLNILPSEVAEELKQTGNSKAKTFSMVSVMFTDFKDFTQISETIGAELLVNELHTCFSAFDGILQKYKIEKIKTIGDSYMCVSGLPLVNETHAIDLVNAAIEIRNYMQNRKKERESNGHFSFELRIGINTGPVVAGIVGIKKFSYDIWGDTVNLASRMESSGEAGKINISGTTHKLVKDKFNCEYRGKLQAKNKGEIDMYFVEI